MVRVSKQAGHAEAAGWLLLPSASSKSCPQPLAWIAWPVLLSTMMCASMEDPASIVRDGTCT
jgi:hypothetical protein